MGICRNELARWSSIGTTEKTEVTETDAVADPYGVIDVENIEDSVLQQYFAGTIKIEDEDPNVELDTEDEMAINTDDVMKFKKEKLEAMKKKWKSKYYNAKGSNDGENRKRRVTPATLTKYWDTFQKFSIAVKRKPKLQAKAIDIGTTESMKLNDEAIEAQEKNLKAQKEAAQASKACLKVLKKQRQVCKQTLKIAKDMAK